MCMCVYNCKVLFNKYWILIFTADNRNKRKRQVRPKMPTDFTIFAEKKENQRIHISPQLTLAMFQYLSTSKEQYLKTDL